jgi:hypothetical protein
MAAIAKWPRVVTHNGYQAKAAEVNELLPCSKSD